MQSSLRDQLSCVMRGARRPLSSQYLAAKEIVQHGRLIVRLPTGAGKTLLAGAPHAAGLLGPKQMIFMTPLRTLSSAQTATLTEQINAEAATKANGSPWKVREQTGSVPGDPLFEASAVVCTFDQALSSALQISYSVSTRRRSINAGAIRSAYLVADELHLFPRDQALTTLLWLLRHRPPQLPFCLMTATLSAPMVRELARLLDAELLDQLPDEDIELLGLANRQRSVQWQDTPITAEQIGAFAAQFESVLVVVNTINRAIGLGREVRQNVIDRPVWVLHSRYFKRDRDEITRDILAAFGREPEHRRPAIVIATQAIEAGVDLSADLLVTELAPANALIQRWGRCARWGGIGTVIVAPPPSADVYPYIKESDGAEIIDRSRTWLREYAGSPLVMDERTEQAFLDAVHAESDERWLHGLAQQLVKRNTSIGNAITSEDYTAAGELIRNIQQRTVLVHPSPERLDKPTRYEGFSLSYGTLYSIGRHAGLGRGALHPEVQDDDEESESWVDFGLPARSGWTFQRPIWGDRSEGSARKADQPAEWHRVESLSELATAPLVAINPALVQYDPALGLDLHAGSISFEQAFWERPIESRRAPFVSHGYQRETFEEHIDRMLRVVESHAALWPRFAPLIGTIEEWLGWPNGMLQRLVRAAIVLHDAGKLAPRWQAAMRDLQIRRGYPAPKWLVHSDSQPGESTGPSPFPPHALSGAAHGLEVAIRFDAEIAETGSAPGDDVPSPGRVLFTAIATHHNTTIKDLAISGQTLLDHAARAELITQLNRYCLPDLVAQLMAGDNLSHCVVPAAALEREADAKEVFALAIVSRLLRLADGWSQELARGEFGLA